MKEEPRYKHDCEECFFLGTLDEYDLYYCGQGGVLATVIARYGSSGPEYLSGWDVNHYALIEARKKLEQLMGQFLLVGM